MGCEVGGEWVLGNLPSALTMWFKGHSRSQGLSTLPVGPHTHFFSPEGRECDIQTNPAIISATEKIKCETAPRVAGGCFSQMVKASWRRAIPAAVAIVQRSGKTVLQEGKDSPRPRGLQREASAAGGCKGWRGLSSLVGQSQELGLYFSSVGSFLGFLNDM